MAMITLDKITKHTGIAGQYSYDVVANHHLDGGEIQSIPVTFVSSESGAPVVMIDSRGDQTFVSDWQRFGNALNPEWIRKFFEVK